MRKRIGSLGGELRIVHRVLVEPLTATMRALIEEGHSIDDESVKRVWIVSGWRSVEEDGEGFLTQLLVQDATNVKAPAGGSAHETGLAIDINFPYPTSASGVQWHDIQSEINDDARRAGAGMWLAQHRARPFLLVQDRG